MGEGVSPESTMLVGIVVITTSFIELKAQLRVGSNEEAVTALC